MSQQISFHNPNGEGQRSIIIGERTLAYQQHLDLPQKAKDIVCNEACAILSHCVAPGQQGCVTNLAVGYVQSGKTMSFTTLTALAADNGYRIIIYLTGTKTNLQNQTASRLKKDLHIDEIDESLNYHVIDDLSDSTGLHMFLTHTKALILIPILKHKKHIDDLTSLLHNPAIRTSLNQYATLIIDDEADQASLNTYAHKNAKKEDWEKDEQSKTYESIIQLKRRLPNHSYIQYTATPQSLLLIDTNDTLSPKYHTVLTPGEGYTGGGFFFKQYPNSYVRTIPNDDLDSSRHPLTECPKTLELALQQFIISVIYKVFIRKEQPFLSMMIHIDGTQAANTKYYRWVKELMEYWASVCDDPVNKDLFKKELEPAYNDLAETISDLPSIDEIFEKFITALLFTKTYLVHSGENNDIDWNSKRGHILVGANMLNRGFTVEKLSMTYMPRTNASTATADTIEQRCRFFGYKMKYVDACRIYVSKKAKHEFTEYVEHEEILREALKQCPHNTIKEYQERANALIISGVLKPTRKNVLSKDYIKHQLAGWKQYRSADFLAENLDILKEFVTAHENVFIRDQVYSQAKRNHRHVDVTIDEAIELLSKFQYYDAELRDRRSSTIQYLHYKATEDPDAIVRIYEMSYLEVRSRSLKDDLKPGNLQAGESTDGGVAYPGDRAFKDDAILTIQLHRIKLDDSQLRPEYHKKETCNICIYYPEGLSFTYYEY